MDPFLAEPARVGFIEGFTRTLREVMERELAGGR